MRRLAKNFTDQEVINEITSPSLLNKARQKFSFWSGRIDQAQRQRVPLSPVELRRMELQAVEDIAATLGVKFGARGLEYGEP